MDTQFSQNVSSAQVLAPKEISKQARKDFSKLGLMYVIGTVLILGIQRLAAAIANAINPDLMSDMANALLITMLPMYIISVPITIFVLRTLPAKQIEKRKMSVGQWILAFLICYGGMYVSNIIGVILTQIIGVIKGSPVTNGMLEVATSSNIPVNFFIMVICAPIAEEILFRKLLIDRTVKYGEATAVLFSGLLFGLFHGNLNQFAYAFTLGLFFGFVYVKTGNVRYTIYLHMLINFISSILGVLVLKFVGEDFLSAMSDPAMVTAYMLEHMGTVLFYFAYAFLLVALAIAGVIILIVNLKKIRFAKGEVVIPKGKRFSSTIVNIGMGLYFIFWIVMIIIQLFS